MVIGVICVLYAFIIHIRLGEYIVLEFNIHYSTFTIQPLGGCSLVDSVSGVVEVLVVEFAAVFGFQVLDGDVVDLAGLQGLKIDAEYLVTRVGGLGDGDGFFVELATPIL